MNAQHARLCYQKGNWLDCKNTSSVFREASTWNRKTLKNLGILPLYFTRNIWGQFKTVCVSLLLFLQTIWSHLTVFKTNVWDVFLAVNKEKVPQELHVPAKEKKDREEEAQGAV